MGLKIIGGQASGIILTTPKNMDVRPTGGRARKALFDSLAASSQLEGKIIVDLFSGTGALGLEAASRGAEQVFIVEKSNYHCSLASENIEKVKRAGVQTEIKVVRSDALTASLSLSHISKNVDIIFADPPYAKFGFFFNRLMKNANFAEWGGSAIMIWEQPPRFEYELEQDDLLWKKEQTRNFAGTTFIFMKAEEMNV